MRQATVIDLGERPAKAGPGQVFTVERIAKGSGKGEAARHRNIGEHPLTLAYERGKISAEDYAAGNTYRVLFEKMNRTGKDSTDIGTPGGGGTADPWTQAQAEAVRAIKAIEAKMAERDRKIVRKVCGEGRSIADGVLSSTACDRDAVIFRFREALEELSDAINGSRRRTTA